MSGSDYELLARYYDLEFANYDADFGFYVGFASCGGSPLLEFGCGTGRLLVPLAEAGYEVTGIDLSPGMLARAHARLAARPDLEGRVSLVQADARQYAPTERYGMAFWAINSFMHLSTQADQLLALERAREALGEGGLLILDLFQPDPHVLAEADGRLTHDFTWALPEGGGQVVHTSSRRLDLAQQTLHVTYFYDESNPDGQTRRTVAPFTMRYLHRFEAQLLLERAGFIIEALYGSYDLDEFDADSQRMIFVARKGP
jgi:SAM-dependent methyltransferase